MDHLTLGGVNYCYSARAQGHGLAPDLAFLDDYMHGYEEFLDYST
jgi:hypothetical protein